jgi:hypothetical protein
MQTRWEILTFHCHQQREYPNKKIEKNILELSNTLGKMDIIDIFTTSDHLSILEHEIIHFSQQPMQLFLK